MSAAAHPQPPSPWLYGPGRDVLFGYGLAFLLSVPPFLWFVVMAGRNSVPEWLVLSLTVALITPHFGATILRAYERREDRRRYAIFTVWITLGLGLLFVASLYSVLLGSLLVTIYVSWTPWHFSGQNYGLGVMYLRRRAIPIDGSVKRAFYGSFVLSAVLAFLSIHMATSSLVFSRGGTDPAMVFQVIQLGIPFEAGLALGGLAGIGWLGCLGFVALHLLRHASAAVLAPIGLLVVMQSLWFAVPALATTTGLFELPPGYSLPFITVWMSAAHSVQYLWVTSYYARRSDPDRGQMVYLGRAMLAGAATLSPSLIFVPGLLEGSVPNGAGTTALVLALLNLHHFFLDGAIWKLREGRVARVLLRSQGAAEGPDRGPLRRVGGLALGVAGGVTLLVQLYSFVLVTIVARADVSLPALRDATTQLAWLGQDNAELWLKLGTRFEAAGESGQALAAYGQHFKRQPQPEPWVAERALRLILTDKAARPALIEQAEGLALYLVGALGDERSEGEEFLAAVAVVRGDGPAAVAAAERALEIARRRGDAVAVARIQRNLDSYRKLASRSAAGGTRSVDAR